jgi:GT2 family glycosyltransferase
MKTPKLAVLMTCYNRKDKTVRCLNTLSKQRGIGTNFNIHVFLVDDNSSDGTATASKSIFPSMTIIQGTGQLYWNKGMHLAWKTAAETDQFDFYVWLNDDVQLFENAFQILIEAYKKTSSESIVCGSTCSEHSGNFTYGLRTKSGQILTPNTEIQYGEVMNGNIVLISAKTFEQVGNLDPVFIHAIGDHDYSLRAHKKGIKTAIPPGYQGYCESHERLPKWCLPDVSFGERIKSLYSPLGNAHPKYFFVYEHRHYGIITALKHYFTIHLRALIPSLWKQ